MSEPIYLDYNATTPILPEVLEAMLPYLREHFGNPSSGHALGRRAKAGVETARAQVASAIGAETEEIVFTSGGTEANNLAVFGAIATSERQHVVTSTFEHPATAEVCDRLSDAGMPVTRVAVSQMGRIDVDAFASAVTEQTAIASVMLANNEIGSIQPIAKLAKHTRRVGALMHTDAAQAIGKIGVNVEALGVDLLSVVGHKVYAPKGVGALYVRRGVQLSPRAFGGGHERGLRPGTENVASIVGLGAACALATRDLATVRAHLTARRDQLLELLTDAIAGIAVNGDLDACLPNTLSVAFPDVAGAELLARAPEVAASTGSACHEGQDIASPALQAMGLAERARGTVRLSIGRDTTGSDIERAAAALIGAFHELS